jgi:hypothetical protein
MAHAEVQPEIVERLRSICAALPEVHEEDAWVGTRWSVRKRTFAHVLVIDAGWPPAYARAVGSNGPITVLMFRAAGDELELLRNAQPPFFAPVWRSDEIGLELTAPIDWTHVAELLTDSYRAQAPKKLAAQVTLPPE